MNKKPCFVISVATLIAGLIFGCGSGGSSDTASATSPSNPTTATVGTAGGEIQVPADTPEIGGVRLSVPAGALDKATTISVEASTETLQPTPVDEVKTHGLLFLPFAEKALAGDEKALLHPMYGPLLTLSSHQFTGPAIALGPSGTAFNKPVTLTIPFSVAGITASDTNLTPLLRSADGSWEIPAFYEFDTSNSVIRIEITHFSLLRMIKNTYIFVTEGPFHGDEIENAKKKLPQDTFEQFVKEAICAWWNDVQAVGSGGQEVPGLFDILDGLYLGSYPGSNPSKQTELKAWILSQDGMVPNNSITLARLFGKSLALNDGNIFTALATVNHLLSADRSGHANHYLNRLIENYRGDGIDESGARYHFFGTAMYAFAYEYKKDNSGEWALSSLLTPDSIETAMTPESVSTLEEGIVSGDLISDPTEYAVDLQGAEVGRRLYREFLKASRGEVISRFNLDENACFDFSYSYTAPGTPKSLQHIESMTQVALRTEKEFTYWNMDKGGVPDGRNLGTVVYRFTFPQNIKEAHLRAYIHTFNWGSKGEGALYASRDGGSWELLYEVPAPEYGEYNYANFNDFIPDTLTGGQDLWIKAELLTYRQESDGSFSDSGSKRSNMAQLSRYRTGNTGPTFRLNVNYE